MAKYSHAALGGTFDHFHKGHKTLINHAFEIAKKVSIGITIDSYVSQKPWPKLIESYNIRCQSVLNYINSIGKSAFVDIVKLSDLYGPTLSDLSIDCLVSSPLTKPGADLINDRRHNVNMALLPIEVCHLELSDDQEPISSTRIRQGEINRDGFVYKQLLQKDIVFSDRQKDEVKKPFGPISQNLDFAKDIFTQYSFIVSVGDKATKLCLQKKLPINFGVFDNKEQRLPVKDSVNNYLINKKVLTASNPAGTITQNFRQALEKAIVENSFVQVEGEEDLAVIPLTLMLPLNSLILYGQPNQGIVLVKITEEKKEWVKENLK